MAGKYVTILNPGYSLLWVKDLLYTVSATELAAGVVNPLNPSDYNPLIEGEFLEASHSGGKPRFTRGGDYAGAGLGDEGDNPAWMYFQEKGRYDAQATKMAHCIMGPAFFEFRTKLCVSTGLSVNDEVTVWDYDGFGSLVRRVLAKKVGATKFVVGRVSRVYGTNDIAVVFGLK